jgi:hypothetical protein
VGSSERGSKGGRGGSRCGRARCWGLCGCGVRDGQGEDHSAGGAGPMGSKHRRSPCERDHVLPAEAPDCTCPPSATSMIRHEHTPARSRRQALARATGSSWGMVGSLGIAPRPGHPRPRFVGSSSSSRAAGTPPARRALTSPCTTFATPSAFTARRPGADRPAPEAARACLPAYDVKVHEARARELLPGGCGEGGGESQRGAEPRRKRRRPWRVRASGRSKLAGSFPTFFPTYAQRRMSD